MTHARHTLNQAGSGGHATTALAVALREHIALRRLRERHFDPALFGEPAWDMLLDLALARMEGRRVSVTSLCIASGVPPTTALRYIGLLEGAELIVRTPHPDDRRSFYLAITDDGFARVESSHSVTAIARAA